MRRKEKAALYSVASNSTLAVAKVAVGLSINSVSVISEGLHSGVDLLASGIAFISVRKAGRPADVDHAYGHGKVENLSAFFEALLIFGAALWIIYEAVDKLVHGSNVGHVGIGVLVMFFSSVANAFIARWLFKEARETDSAALEADGAHLSTDVFTSAGVMFGLFLVYLTGNEIFDPLVALVVAAMIMRTAYCLTVKAINLLTDVKLPPGEEAIVKEVINEHSGEFVEFHKLRTRKAGPDRYMDLHLVVPADQHVSEAHHLCNELEQAIGARLPNTSVVIHLEPCDSKCDACNGRMGIEDRNLCTGSLGEQSH